MRYLKYQIKNYNEFLRKCLRKDRQEYGGGYQRSADKKGLIKPKLATVKDVYTAATMSTFKQPMKNAQRILCIPNRPART